MAVLILSLTLTISFLYNYFQVYEARQLKNELSRTGIMINENYKDYSKILSGSTYRFTLIDKDGEVIYDNRVNSDKMENHSERVEIKEAIKDGAGESVRYSSTLTEKTVYASIRLDKGSILRIAVSQKSITALTVSMLPYILVIIFIAVVISFISARYIARSITAPFWSLDLEHPVENDTYDELGPVLTKLNKQHKQIKSQIEVLRQKQDEFDKIISSMNEGLVLLDENSMIITMNTAARRIFDIKDEDIFNKDFLKVDRTPEVNNAVINALEGKNSEILIGRNGCKYQLNITSIEYGEGKIGVVILIFDITDKFFAERNRREFSANVTHELKTPLQSIIGSAELIETGLAKPEDIGKFISNIRSEAVRLGNLINDIIQLSQLDEDTSHIMKEVAINEVISEVVEVLTPLSKKRNITFELLCDDVVIKGVRRYIYEIVYNLCENAVRYNVDGGKVYVKAYKDKGNIFIEVSDTGIGIEPEHRARIFERFYRVDKSHSRETGGTGLGLSIVKHAVQFHGGKIELESEFGKGTDIKVIF